MNKSPYGTNILVTGASSGIGLACALLFASKGFEVWGVSRSGSVCRDMLPNIHLSCMDVTDEQSVAAEVGRIWREALALTGSGIGTVVHCAGFGIGGAAEDTSHPQALRQFETNYFGVLRVNRILLPLMRSRGRAMVVVLGSIAGRISIPFQSHYSASKFALEAYVEALRMEGAPFGIHATIVEPGDTKTGFTGQRIIAIPQESPYALTARIAIEKMEHDEQNGASAESVASVIYRVATTARPPVRKPVGTGYSLLLFAKRLLPDRMTEKIIGSLYLRKQKS